MKISSNEDTGKFCRCWKAKLLKKVLTKTLVANKLPSYRLLGESIVGSVIRGTELVDEHIGTKGLSCGGKENACSYPPS